MTIEKIRHTYIHQIVLYVKIKNDGGSLECDALLTSTVYCDDLTGYY